MNAVIRMVESLRRAIVAVVLLGVMVLGLVAPAYATPGNSADRGSDVTRASDTTYKGRNVIQADRAPLPPGTVKKIQSEAEDLGDSPERPIGDTGLKNIRKLGENIPETLDLKAKQTKEIYAPKGSDLDKNLDKVGRKADRIQDKIEDTVKDLMD